MSKGDTVKNARHVLLGYLEAGQTGCITGETPHGRRVLYVMLGELLSAQSTEDDRRVLQILWNEGAVDRVKLEGLDRVMRDGQPLSEALFDCLSDERVMELFFERFRDNVFSFLVGDGVHTFTPMETVFTDNIQVGHDSKALIEELWGLRTRAAGLLADEDVRIAPGHASPTDAEQARLAEMCEGGLALRALLRQAPKEFSRALDVVVSMLDVGALRMLPAEVPPLESSDDDVTEESAGDESTESAEARGPVDDELAAFQDHDTSRQGGDFSGEILDRVEVSEEPREVLPQPQSVEMVIEMEDAEQAIKDGTVQAVSLNFSGPELNEEDALRKIAVVNEVLTALAEYLSAAEGAGAGQAQVQLLVEGTPGNLAPLVKGLEVDAEGRIPAQVFLKNLRKRPAPERRRLLDRALSDLIDRALSVANEALPEETLEEMLERIAGYQQKLR